MTNVSIIDMGMGNLASVAGALQRVGADPVIVDSPDGVAIADALILPGVGAFGDGMAHLRERSLFDPIQKHAASGKPILGLCLGMQLLADSSDEHGHHQGLGLIPGAVVKLQPTHKEFRIPNMGWCRVRSEAGSPLFAGLDDDAPFYFVHSYHFIPKSAEVISATIDYSGQRLVMGVARGTIFGLQFHPEKSQDAGLALLHNFVAHVEGLCA